MMFYVIMIKIVINSIMYDKNKRKNEYANGRFSIVV